jgi:hypothetical protein
MAQLNDATALALVRTITFLTFMVRRSGMVDRDDMRAMLEEYTSNIAANEGPAGAEVVAFLKTIFDDDENPVEATRLRVIPGGKKDEDGPG